MNMKKLWLGFVVVMIVSFGILGYFGREIYREAPPIPERVITSDGTVLFTAQDIMDGQFLWGGIDVGETNPSCYSRVLEMVGGSFMG